MARLGVKRRSGIDDSHEVRSTGLIAFHLESHIDLI
jgi:hypothetical protein